VALRGALALLALLLLAACDPVFDDDDSSSDDPGFMFEAGDAAESEPNDSAASANSLGTVWVGFSVTGDAATCGADGTLAGSDVDWLSLSIDTQAPVRLRLDMYGGDLDFAVLDDDGVLVAEGATTGVEDEELALALDPNRVWLVRIRCWMGNPGALWRLRVL
jgi:hypothetical protein